MTMNKGLKLVLAGLIVIIILALLAPLFISENFFRQPLIDKIQAATGRTLTINGDLKLRVFPSAYVSMDNVAISNPEGFPDSTPFMTLNSLKVSIATTS